MTTITCQECGQESAEIACICSTCGQEVILQSKAYKSHVAYNRMAAGLIFWGGAAWLSLDSFVLHPHQFTSDFKWALGAMVAGAIIYLLGETTRNLGEKKSAKICCPKK